MVNFIDERNGSTKRQTIDQQQVTDKHDFIYLYREHLVMDWIDHTILTMLISPTDINLFTMRSSTQRLTSCYRNIRNKLQGKNKM
jgi:hypothetical protein